MIALKLVLGWQSSRSWTSRQAKGGRVAAQSDPLCPTSRGQLSFSRGASHLTLLNPGSWPGAKSPRRMNPHNTHCSAGWCLQYAPRVTIVCSPAARMEDHRLPNKANSLGSCHLVIMMQEILRKDTRIFWRTSAPAKLITASGPASIAANRQTWRSTVHQAVCSFESNCRAGLEEKRGRRRIREMAAPNPNQTTFSRSLCGHPCLSQIGRISHERVCRRHGRLPS